MLQNWRFQKSFDSKKFHLISKCRFYYTVKYTERFWYLELFFKKCPFPVNFRSIFQNHSQKLQKCLGLELGVKANLKTLSPRSQFQLWAQTELSLTDMTNKMKFHSLQLTSHAPTIPRIYGTLRQVFNSAFWLAVNFLKSALFWKLFWVPSWVEQYQSYVKQFMKDS